MMNRLFNVMCRLGALVLVLQLAIVTSNPGCVLRVSAATYDSLDAPAGLVVGQPSLDATQDAVDPCQKHAEFAVPSHDNVIPTISLQFDVQGIEEYAPKLAVYSVSPHSLRLPAQLTYAPLEIPPIVSL